MPVRPVLAHLFFGIVAGSTKWGHKRSGIIQLTQSEQWKREREERVGHGGRQAAAQAAAVGIRRSSQKQQEFAAFFWPGSPSPSTVWTDAAMMGVPSGDSNSI